MRYMSCVAVPLSHSKLSNQSLSLQRETGLSQHSKGQQIRTLLEFATTLEQQQRQHSMFMQDGAQGHTVAQYDSRHGSSFVSNFILQYESDLCNKTVWTL